MQLRIPTWPVPRCWPLGWTVSISRIDPGVASQDNLYEVPWEELHARGIGHLPATLQAAVEALSQDDVVRNSLGAEYADYYIQVKTEEWESYHNSVSQWELDHYLNVH